MQGVARQLYVNLLQDFGSVGFQGKLDYVLLAFTCGRVVGSVI